MITKAEKNQLLARAEKMVAHAGGPNLTQAQFNVLIAEFQTTMGISKERARHWMAKAIRRARNPKKR